MREKGGNEERARGKNRITQRERGRKAGDEQ